MSGFPSVPKMMEDEKEHRRKLSEVLDRVNKGKFNCTLSVTLTVSATSTTVKDERIGFGCYLDLMPLTANASIALANVYYTSLMKGQVTINHASSSNADQDFTMLILA